MVKESLNPSPKSADVQEDDTRNACSVKVEEEQLASVPTDGLDRNKVENSLMEVNPKGTSLPGLFRYVGVETLLHFLCECEALARMRVCSSGKGFPTQLGVEVDLRKNPSRSTRSSSAANADKENCPSR